jgi:hypothetical protein
MLKSWRCATKLTGKIGARPYTLHPAALLWSHRTGVVRIALMSKPKKTMLDQCQKLNISLKVNHALS